MKYKRFGLWLKTKLKDNNILQQELAHEICVSTNTVTSWTTGAREPGIRNFIWICRFFAIIEGVHPTEIISEAADLF